jgi:hypothetical protein
VTDKVSIRAHFERFPVSMKGAFVLRGADRDPHQVRIDAADIVELSGGGRVPIGLQKLTLDVAPKLDLFVPFEFPVTELGPGWYGLECRITIDGDAAAVRPGKRFAVPWPRATVRRGAVPVGKAVVAAGTTLRLDQVDCAGDSIKIAYTAPEAASLKVSADGVTITVLEEEFDDQAGKGRVTAYPLLRSQSRLAIEVRGASTPVDITLP